MDDGGHANDAATATATAATALSRRGQRWRNGQPRTWDEYMLLAGGHMPAALRKWEESEPVDYEELNEEIFADPWGWDIQCTQWDAEDAKSGCLAPAFPQSKAKRLCLGKARGRDL